MDETKMMKTSNRKCAECLYSTGGEKNGTICFYYIITKKRRNCEIGFCDKYKKATRKEKVTMARKLQGKNTISESFWHGEA